MDASQSRYCLRCGYMLRGLMANRCPECGQAYEPDKPETFRRTPMRRRHSRLLLCGAVGLILVALAYGAMLLWFYRGWHAERPVVAAVNGPRDRVVTRVVWPREILPIVPTRFRDWGERVTELHLFEHEITPDLFEAITKCEHLRILDLNGGAVTGEQLSLLPQAAAIEELSLSGERLKDGDLASLRMLPRLRSLSIYWGDALTDASAQDIATCVSLRELSLGEAKWSEKGVETICAGLDLEVLSLPPIDDRALQPLRKLRNLRELHLGRGLVTDAGLEVLQHLPNLGVLQLCGCERLTDRAVEPLMRCSGLKLLSVALTETISRAALLRLHQALPYTVIVCGDGRVIRPTATTRKK